MTDDELLRMAHDIARSWAQSALWLADEYESVTIAAAGEVLATHDPDRLPMHLYARYLMHKRCRDLNRSWITSRRGRHRSVTLRAQWWSHRADYDGDNFEDEFFEARLSQPPYDDTAWLLANLLRAVDEAHEGGRVTAKARDAVYLWIELGEQVLVAERLGVTASRVSQLVHMVIDAVQEIGVAS